MKIIISPAKKMVLEEWCENLSEPIFYKEANELLYVLKMYSKEELNKVLKCNDKLLDLNYERYQSMDDVRGNSGAVFSYVGLQYQHLASSILEDRHIRYLNSHLRIVSGLYGLLKPNDGIKLYRLEMQSKLDSFSLYDYWGSKIHDELYKEDDTVINLASKEYSDCVTKYIKDKEKMITISFMENVNGKLKMKGTQAKIARGEMVRYMALCEIEDINEIKKFNIGYHFSEKDSSENEWIFIRD